MSEVHSNSLLLKYKGSIEDLQDALVRERKLRQEGERENRSLRKQCLSLEESLIDSKRSNEELYSNYQLSLTQGSDLNEKLQMIGSKLEEAYSYIEERDKLIENLHSRLSSHATVQEMQKQVSSLQSDLKTSYDEIKEKDKAIEEWAASISILEHQLQSLQKDNQCTIETLTQQNDELSHSNSVLSEEKEKLAGILDSVYANLNDLNEQYQNTKRQKVELENLLNSQVKDIEANLALNENNYKDLLGQKEQSIIQLENQLSNAQIKLEKTMKLLIDTRDSEERYLTLSRKLQEQVEENSNVIHTLNVRMQDEIACVKATYEEKLSKMVQENKDEFETQLRQYKVELDEEVIRGEQCHDSYQLQALQIKEQYMKELIDKEEEVQVLNDDRRRLQEVMKEMQVHLERLQAQVEKNKNAPCKVQGKDKIQYWKCKFTEEIGYMARWADDMSDQDAENKSRLQAIIERLTKILD